MSKQSAPTASGMGAEVRNSAGVIPDESPETLELRNEVERVKEEQMARVEELDRETLIGLFRQMLLVLRFE